MRPYLISSTRYLLSCDTDRNGYIEHDSQFPETWMDTLKRDSRAIDIQALFHSALVSSGELLKIAASEKAMLREIESRTGFLSKNLERDYFQNGFFADRFFWKKPVNIRTANSLVPLICGFREHSKEILEAIESEPFTTQIGVRTRAGGEEGFDPGGYHTGQAWSLTTAWACAAEFLSARPVQGWRYLRLLLNDLDRDALGCIGECWNSSNLSLSGCSLQLWGSGFIPRLVDEFMLGIVVNSINKTIAVSPRLPTSIKTIERLRQTGLGPVRIRFKRSGRDVKPSCSDKRFRIIMKP
jgi:glycogen debranching enzyme